MVNENVRGQDVYIVQPTCPPVNENLIELMLMVGRAPAPAPHPTHFARADRECPLPRPGEHNAPSVGTEDHRGDPLLRLCAPRPQGVAPCRERAICLCTRVHLVRLTHAVPPLPSPQMTARVPISAADVARLLEAMGVDRVVAVDLHCGQIQGFFGPRVPVDNLDGGTVGVSYFAKKALKNPGARGPRECCPPCRADAPSPPVHPSSFPPAPHSGCVPRRRRRLPRQEVPRTVRFSSPTHPHPHPRHPTAAPRSLSRQIGTDVGLAMIIKQRSRPGEVRGKQWHPVGCGRHTHPVYPNPTRPDRQHGPGGHGRRQRRGDCRRHDRHGGHADHRRRRVEGPRRCAPQHAGNARVVPSDSPAPTPPSPSPSLFSAFQRAACLHLAPTASSRARRRTASRGACWRRW